jgi:hypothetical protein
MLIASASNIVVKRDPDSAHGIDAIFCNAPDNRLALAERAETS